MDSFWMVWNPKDRTPTVKHETEESAKCEAERLAKLPQSNGATFFVLKATSMVRKYEPPVTWEDLMEPCDIPF